MNRLMNIQLPRIAYFSMEIGIEPNIPTYSGGLGILAGDTLRAAADLSLPMTAVTLMYRKGYFRQGLDADGNQSVQAVNWSPDQFLEPLEPVVTVTIEGRPVGVRAWRYLVHGATGNTVPIYFLDTHLPQNSEWDRNLTGALYNRDDHFRICQEVVLGFGGIAMLPALGHPAIEVYHMNEGHSALLTLALLERHSGGIEKAAQEGREAVRKKCVFTTHTPIPAGHDRFSKELACQVLGTPYWEGLRKLGFANPELNMTDLALFFSRYVNGVAMRHGEVSRDMFPNYPIDSITNGIHTVSWTSPPFAKLFDTFIPDWRRDAFYLRHAITIPLDDIRQAHHEAKVTLFDHIRKQSGVVLNPGIFTIGYARRMTAYKRPNFLFTDLDRLRAITKVSGPMQIVYSGKAHPRDDTGKDLIRQIFRAAADLKDAIRVVFLEEYNMALARKLCAGVDVWLNTPNPPLEASGTSGMKAAVNGVPSLSILDGWWIEGHTEGVTGWAIGGDWKEPADRSQEVNSLYSKLQDVIMPLYYKSPREFDKIRQSTIVFNGSFFNTQRMMLQYLMNAYISI